MYKNYVKRILDVFLSLMGIITLSPLLLLLAIAIKTTSPGPILFKQKRVGKNNELFYIYKFRTMRIDTPKNIPTHLLENPDQYITRIGRIMRKTSLDELPQLINILKGEMAIIGPRPSLPNQIDLNKLRDENGSSAIRPGLTGLAQISGRDELEIDIKAALDGEYTNKISFLFDCKCFISTITSVLKREGVVEGGTGELHKEEEPL